ncbi:hypothetical protein PFISCL1PPCAC_28613, partial [Pristionchus fissidentatus]
VIVVSLLAIASLVSARPEKIPYTADRLKELLSFPNNLTSGERNQLILLSWAYPHRIFGRDFIAQFDACFYVGLDYVFNGIPAFDELWFERENCKAEFLALINSVYGKNYLDKVKTFMLSEEGEYVMKEAIANAFAGFFDTMQKGMEEKSGNGPKTTTFKSIADDNDEDI